MDKKLLNLFFISLLFLFLVSSVNATDVQELNDTILSDCNSYHMIASNLSNEDIQNKFDNANPDDTFEFTDKEYNNISLVVDKKLTIISKSNSVVYASNSVSDKAKSLGIDKTFGFYFTQNSAGSVLSGITVIASGCDYGVVVDNVENVNIKDNTVTGGINSILVKNSDNIVIEGNNISKAKRNGLQILDVRNSLINNNDISYNKKSGIETSNIDHCNITNNKVHHNDLNGISTYNKSSYILIKGNEAYENVNGIYINSTSVYDRVTSNSLTYNRKDPRSPMGGFETGNGLLFGAGFRSAGEFRLIFQYNYLAHNEFFQAKNYWENDDYKLEDNWFDSTDPTNTFVCPRLLASLMKLDTLSISNGLGFQMKDASGKSVEEFATFQTKVNVNGNQYTAKFVNGKAVIDVELDPNVEYDVGVEIGGQIVNYKYTPAEGEKGESSSDKSTSNEGDNGFEEAPSQNQGTSEVQGDSTANSNSTSYSNSTTQSGSANNKGNSSGSHIDNSVVSGNYGTNSSDIPSQDTSDNGKDALSNGDFNAGNAGDSQSGDQSQEGKAYEIIPPVTTSKEIINTSGLVVLSILALMGCLIYGYRCNSKDEFD